MKTFYRYQIEDGDHAAKQYATLIGHEPRVGKSGCAIRAANVREAKLVVVLCPANVKMTWLQAIDDFRDGEWVAVVVSYAKAGEFNMRMRRWGRRIDVLIVDESHYAKERSAARTKAVYGPVCDGNLGLSGMADCVICLTGTPMPNNPTELWPMLRALVPQLILNEKGKPMSFSSFRDRYCAVAGNGFGGLKIKGARRYGELKGKLFGTGFMIRRTRAEVFGRDILPPTTVQIPPPNAAAMKEIKALEATEDGKAIRQAIERGGLAAVAKIGGTTAATLRRLYGLAKVEGLAAIIADELKEEPGLKMIIGAWHLDVIHALAAALRKFGALEFSGQMTKERKNRVQHQFMYDPTKRVVCGQINAMGVGLDFSAADICTFAEQSWVGTDNEQFRSRIFNPECKRPKFTRFAVLPGTTDTQIARAAERKLSDARKLFG